MNGYVKVTYVPNGKEYFYAVPDYIALADIGDFAVCENTFYSVNGVEPCYKVVNVVAVYGLNDVHCNCNYSIESLKPIVGILSNRNLVAYKKVREKQLEAQRKQEAEAKKAITKQAIKDTIVDFLVDFCDKKINDDDNKELTVQDCVNFILKHSNSTDIEELKSELARVM